MLFKIFYLTAQKYVKQSYQCVQNNARLFYPRHNFNPIDPHAAVLHNHSFPFYVDSINLYYGKMYSNESVNKLDEKKLNAIEF